MNDLENDGLSINPLLQIIQALNFSYDILRNKSPKQQRRPLLSLLYLSFFYVFREPIWPGLEN